MGREPGICPAQLTCPNTDTDHSDQGVPVLFALLFLEGRVPRSGLNGRAGRRAAFSSQIRSFPGRPPPAASRPGQTVPETSPETACRNADIGTVSGTIGTMTTAPAYDNSVRIGYAR